MGASGSQWDPVGSGGIRWDPVGAGGIRWEPVGSGGILGSRDLLFTPWIRSYHEKKEKCSHGFLTFFSNDDVVARSDRRMMSMTTGESFYIDSTGNDLCRLR